MEKRRGSPSSLQLIYEPEGISCVHTMEPHLRRDDATSIAISIDRTSALSGASKGEGRVLLQLFSHLR